MKRAEYDSLLGGLENESEILCDGKQIFSSAVLALVSIQSVVYTLLRRASASMFDNDFFPSDSSLLLCAELTKTFFSCVGILTVESNDAQ